LTTLRKHDKSSPAHVGCKQQSKGQLKQKEVVGDCKLEPSLKPREVVGDCEYWNLHYNLYERNNYILKIKTVSNDTY